MSNRGAKITDLNSVSNVTSNLIFAVVDPSISNATPDGQTLQMDVDQLGTYILAEAGNTFPLPAAANTVKNNAQPNITSLGNLTSLNVSGVSNLGPIENLRLTGGSNGMLIATYGNGVLYWNAGGPIGATGSTGATGASGLAGDKYTSSSVTELAFGNTGPLINSAGGNTMIIGTGLS